jgi:hypothetical protein
MNEATLRIKAKIEAELKEAEHQMRRYDFNGQMGYQPINFNYWRKEALDLRKELREVNTGRVKY